jgi:hypothetical protein
MLPSLVPQAGDHGVISVLYAYDRQCTDLILAHRMHVFRLVYWQTIKVEECGEAHTSHKHIRPLVVPAGLSYPDLQAVMVNVTSMLSVSCK